MKLGITGIMTVALLFVFRFLIYTELPLYGTIKKYDGLLAVTLLTIFWFLSSHIVAWLWKNKRENRLPHILLIVAAAFVLILPMTKINDAQSSKTENRNLAKLPSLITEKGFNYEYGKQFEAWLNDHFRGRDKALQIYLRVESFLRGKRENDRAMEGNDGWLFYKGDNSVKNFQNQNNFTEEELQTLKKKLEEKRDFCASFGAHYYVLIAPDKNKIYGEFYPAYYYKKQPIGRGEQLYRYLKKNSDIEVGYPLLALLEAKKQNQLYYKGDTHWNSVGAFIGYQELMKLIAKDDATLQIFSLEDFDKNLITIRSGDLQNMLDIHDWQEEDPVLNFKGDSFYQTKEIDIQTTELIAMEGRPFLATNQPTINHRVFVFRDSFSTALIPFLSQQFGQVEYLWTREFFKNASVIKEKAPDIVIEEVVERYVQDLVN